MRQHDRAEDGQEEDQIERRDHRQGDSGHHSLFAPPLLLSQTFGFARVFQQARMIGQFQSARFAEFRLLLGLRSALWAVHSGLPHSFNFFFTCAGTPATSDSGGTSLMTTEPAPDTEPRPTRTGATSIVSEPIFTSSSINVGCFCLPS